MMHAQGQPLSLKVPPEQRLVDLQAQIDQLTLTLQMWRASEDHLQPMEYRLTLLTQQCSEMLASWRTTGARHAEVVDALETRLVGWAEIEARLQHKTSERLQDLERSIEKEWTALRQLHEAPVRQLREQAARLTEVCAAAAGSAQTGLERAEARLAMLEGDLHRKIDGLSQGFRLAVAELRAPADLPALRGELAPWPLDDVARLHSQLREAGEGSSPAVRGGAAALARRGAEQPTGLEARLSARRQWALTAALAGCLIVAAWSAIAMNRRVARAAEHAVEAEQSAQRAMIAAEARVNETRAEAARQISEAREVALKAQMMSDVLAAPDLIRFSLGGGSQAGRGSAQVLLSRSRGVVFSGSGLNAVAPDSTYQVWLWTAARPVSVGTFVPDASGRATLSLETVPALPRVLGAGVTLEKAPGGDVPAGPAVLTRAE
jgi:hypothetical protein